jgi:hypothetical protein
LGVSEAIESVEGDQRVRKRFEVAGSERSDLKSLEVTRSDLKSLELMRGWEKRFKVAGSDQRVEEAI